MQRSDFQTLTKRLQEPTSLIQVIAGPRQVGKTTLLNQVFSKLEIHSIYVTADAITNATEEWIIQEWNKARLELSRNHKVVVLAIDEIQKISQWSETVKRLWDEDKINNINLKIVLLGSSQLLLHQGLSESLAGRFEIIQLPHWRFKEMKEAFGITEDQYMWYGFYPGAVPFINDETRWKNYVRDALAETAISKDILMLTRVDKPALLRRLFETGSHYSGKILSYTKLMGQLQDAGNSTTLAHYLNLLEQASLLCGLQKYAGDEARQKSSSPKFQTFNPALVNSYSHETFDEVIKDPMQWGRVIESGIGAYLLTYKHEGIKLSYWRQGDNEVDFIIEYKDQIVALEVKTGKQKSSGIKLFNKNFNPSRIYLIGSGGIPWKEFINIHPKDLF